MEVSCRVLHKAFSCRLLHVILICKSLHVRRLPWIPFPSPRRAKLASTCARHASHRGSPVRPSLKKPVFRSACSHRSSWEMPRAFGSTSCWRFSVLSDWLSLLKGISPTRNIAADAPHADLQPCSTPRCHHAQCLLHSHRRCAAIPVLADAPFTSELYDKAFADFAISNLGVSIAANASAQTKPEGR